MQTNTADLGADLKRCSDAVIRSGEVGAILLQECKVEERMESTEFGKINTSKKLG